MNFLFFLIFIQSVFILQENFIENNTEKCSAMISNFLTQTSALLWSKSANESTEPKLTASSTGVRKKTTSSKFRMDLSMLLLRLNSTVSTLEPSYHIWFQSVCNFYKYFVSESPFCSVYKSKHWTTTWNIRRKIYFKATIIVRSCRLLWTDGDWFSSKNWNICIKWTTENVFGATSHFAWPKFVLLHSVFGIWISAQRLQNWKNRHFNTTWKKPFIR